MKLSEIEALLESGVVTEENITIFKMALKHAPKAMRCQHCYTTAASFPKEKWEQAISLIQYGLQEQEVSWVDQMRSYCNMAIIYETANDYANALAAYQDSLAAIDDERRKDYEPSIAADMMRVELHRCNFQFTDNLYNYYVKSLSQDDFSKAFKHRRFYQSVVEIVIHSHNGELKQADAAHDRAMQILTPDYQGPLRSILLRNKHDDSAKATKDAIRYLKSYKRHR